MSLVRSTLRSFVIDNFLFGRTDQHLADDASLIENGIVDSTGVLMLVSYLETHFSVSVLDEEIVPDNLDSIDRLVAFVTRKQPRTLATEAPDGEPTLSAFEFAEAKR